MRMDMWIDMCKDVWIGTLVDMWMDMSIEVFPSIQSCTPYIHLYALRPPIQQCRHACIHRRVVAYRVPCYNYGISPSFHPCPIAPDSNHRVPALTGPNTAATKRKQKTHRCVSCVSLSNTPGGNSLIAF